MVLKNRKKMIKNPNQSKNQLKEFAVGTEKIKYDCVSKPVEKSQSAVENV